MAWLPGMAPGRCGGIAWAGRGAGRAPAAPVFEMGPGARPSIKERALWIAVVGLFFFLAYGGANAIAALTAPHPAPYMAWERAIPFLPAFILPYLSSDILFAVAFLAAPDRASLQRLGLRCGLAIALSAAVFVALPLQFGFERPEVEGWTAPLFGLLGLDQPYNQFPSLYVSLGLLAWHGIDRRLAGAWRLPLAVWVRWSLAFWVRWPLAFWVRWPLALWFLAVAASTLLVRQHPFIDLPGGVAVAALAFRLVPEGGAGRMRLNFVTPRHLGMAPRYLVLAAVAAAAAFSMPALAPPLGWLALSLAGVAAAYTLGLNGFLGKRRGGYRAITWLVFWPYLAGSWLNWRWWRGRAGPMAEVAPGLWLGGRPGRRDWDRIEAAGVAAIIDLAPELPSSPPAGFGMTHDHLPLLDIAIPAPAALDEIARRIEHRRRAGGVYVHCALGLSRGVLAVSAWMMRQGMTAGQALAAIDRVRPARVRRPYMRIALDLYAEYLGGQDRSA